MKGCEDKGKIMTCGYDRLVIKILLVLLPGEFWREGHREI